MAHGPLVMGCSGSIHTLETGKQGWLFFFPHGLECRILVKSVGPSLALPLSSFVSTGT